MTTTATTSSHVVALEDRVAAMKEAYVHARSDTTPADEHHLREGFDDIMRQVRAEAANAGMYAAVNDLAVVVGQGAADNGWHDRYAALVDSRDAAGLREHIVSKLALIMSEAAEAIEEIRTDKPMLYEGDGGKPEGVASELADVVIRALDLAFLLRIDIGAVIEAKAAFNATRGRMHGGKKL